MTGKQWESVMFGALPPAFRSSAKNVPSRTLYIRSVTSDRIVE
jgi:hypothetical protein